MQVYVTVFVGLLLLFQGSISSPLVTSINNVHGKRAPMSDDDGCNTCEISPGVTACCWPPTTHLLKWFIRNCSYLGRSKWKIISEPVFVYIIDHFNPWSLCICRSDEAPTSLRIPLSGIRAHISRLKSLWTIPKVPSGGFYIVVRFKHSSIHGVFVPFFSNQNLSKLYTRQWLMEWQRCIDHFRWLIASTI
jgi:hypothetical protein